MTVTTVKMKIAVSWRSLFIVIDSELWVCSEKSSSIMDFKEKR